MLTAADFERMLVEDRQQRARADHWALAERGMVQPNPVGDEDDDDEIGVLDEKSMALLAAIVELLDKWKERAWDPQKHPRGPGGKFRSTVDRLKDAIESHVKSGGKGHPFDEFDREQLRRVAKARGIPLKRGEDRDSIAQKLLDHLKGENGGPPTAKPKATKVKSTPKPKTKSTAATVIAGDFTGLKRVGDQAGSNKGGFYEADDGSRWYVKAQSSTEHAANEALASALYREAGVDVPHVVRGKGAPGLGEGSQTASRVVDGAKSDLHARLGDQQYIGKLREGFAVDAWLANWDVAGATLDNVVSDKNNPVRIDLGGSLLFRAQGAPKGSAFGNDALEWDTLRDPSMAPQASKLFGTMSTAELADSAAKLEGITPARIRALVAEQGLGGDVAERLIARRANILDRAKPSVSFADRIAKAAAGQAALDSVPVAKKDYLGAGLELVPAANKQSVLMALTAYQGAAYARINEALRDPSLTPDFETSNNIRRIDQVVDLSPLPGDTVVYRGIRDGKIFGGDTVLESGRDLTGLEFAERAYSSTSADKRVADEFATNGGTSPVVMRILAPAGMKGVRLSDMGFPGQTSFTPGTEAEILLQRGLKFRVVGDSKKLVNGARRLDVEVIT